jgi:hypothetical protein
MADVMNSLFGMTPESIQRQRDNELQARALQFAKLDPQQAAQMAFYTAGSRLGDAGAGLLGAKDPELQRITQRQTLLQQTQPSDAAGWSSLGSRLMQAGDIQGAQEAYSKAQTLTNSSIKNALDTSTTASNLATAAGRQFDITPEGRGQELAKTGKFTSESIKNFIAGKGQLEAVDKLTKPQADFIAKAVELGYGEKSNYGGYSQEQTAKVNAALFKEDLTKKTATAPKIDLGIGGVLEKFGAQADAKAAGEAWSKAGEIYKNQVSLIPKLEAVEKALPNTFTGSFANAALQLGKAASAAGIPVDSAKLSNTEYLNSVTAQLVRTIARDFPGSQSNAELQQLLASKPSSAQEWDTIVRLLRDVKKEAKTSTKTYERMGAMSKEERYKTDFNTEYGKTFKDFNQKTNRLNELAQKLNSKTISDTEREEAKKLQEELR